MREEVPRGARAGVGGDRVVRIAEEDQPRAAGRIRQPIQVRVEVLIERNGADGIAHHVRVAGALFVGRDRPDERLVLGREQVRARAENLGGAAAEDDVLGLRALMLGERVNERARLV